MHVVVPIPFKLNLVRVPTRMWASVEDVAVYQLGMKVNAQIGEVNAMLAVAEMVWLDNLNDLSTNIIRIHQDSTAVILISIDSSVR